jgi:uncharacterized protein (DUF924 family)
MHRKILKFWFEEIEQSQWWVKDEAFDKMLTDRFSEIHASATRCELYEWRVTAPGRLAEIIVLDQFSRNMFRDTPLAFSNDPLALALSQEVVSSRADKLLGPQERSFLYMPFMHSESMKIHEVATDLFSRNGVQSSLDFELKHKSIIERFGRYPHRNSILGRASTAEEIEFLKLPGSGF